MPDYRRYYIPNAIVFITVVTRDRKPFLLSDAANILWETISNVQVIHSFDFIAHIILPDHAHWLMRVHDIEGDYSKIMHSIKRNFTMNYKKHHTITSSFSVWQKRFWDHVIRDEYDFSRHLDYIHWNCVKHKYVNHPEDWPHSSYVHWQRIGYYPERWGWMKEPYSITGMDCE